MQLNELSLKCWAGQTARLVKPPASYQKGSPDHFWETWICSNEIIYNSFVELLKFLGHIFDIIDI